MTRKETIKVLKKDLQIIDDPKVTMTAREWEEHDDQMRDALEMAIEALQQEPKRGEWVKTYPHMLSVEEQRFYGAKDPKEPMPDKRFSVTVCSLCGETRPCGEDNYCPNCGARMESDGE